jgi:hypothetical protein
MDLEDPDTQIAEPETWKSPLWNIDIFLSHPPNQIVNAHTYALNLHGSPAADEYG